MLMLWEEPAVTFTIDFFISTGFHRTNMQKIPELLLALLPKTQTWWEMWNRSRLFPKFKRSDTHDYKQIVLTDCEIMGRGRQCCLCRSKRRAEPEATLPFSNSTCKCSCPLQIPLAPSFTNKMEENHLSDTSSIARKLSTLFQRNLGLFRRLCSFHWKEKCQCFPLNEGVTRTAVLQEPSYLKRQRLPPHILQKGRSRNQGILGPFFQG